MNASADPKTPSAESANGDGFPPLARHRLDRLFPALLLILSLLPMVPYLVRHQTILGAIPAGNCENLNEWMLFRRIIAENTARGFLPAWMPEFNSGTPLVGWTHASRFAPLGVIYSWLPFPTAAVVGTYVHLAIFTLSMYLLLRLLSRSPPAAFLACLLGMLLYQIGEADHFLPRLFSFSWTPLLFACYVAIWRTRRLVPVVGAMVVLGLQILGGNMETIGREFLTLAILAAAILAVRPGAAAAHRQALALIAASVAGGVVLGLVQFLPVYEFVRWSTRSDPAWFTYEIFSSTAAPRHVLAYGRVALGAITPAVVFLSLTELRRRPATIVILITMTALALLSANPFGLLRLAYRLPFIGEMMWHHLNFYFINILLVVLTAQAADHLLAAGFRRHLLLLAASCAAFALFLRLEAARFAVTSYQYPMDLVAGYQDSVYGLYLALALIGGLAAALPNRVRIAPVWLALLFLVEGFMPSFFILHRQTDPFPDFNPKYLEFFSRPHPVARSMNQAPASRFGRRSLPYQLGYLTGEQTTDSFLTSSIRWYGEFYMQLLQPGPDGQQPRRNFQELKNLNYISERNIPLLNLLNVVYIITEETNLKFASHYFPAYYFTPDACPARACRRTGLDGLSTAGVAVTPPGAWDQTWIALPGSSFHFQLRAIPSDGRPAPAWVQVRARPDDSGINHLLFARFLAGADWDRPGPDRAMDLSGLENRTLHLRVEVLSQTDPADPADPAEIEIVNPAVLNPNAYFKRLDLFGLNVFVNSGALARAFIVHEQKVIADPEARLAYLRDRAFAPAQVAVLEAPAPGPLRQPGRSAVEKVEIVTYDADRIVIAAGLAEPGLLLLSDVYYPGWRAEADGRETRVLRADHAFRAVFLDPGRHALTFTFRPVSLRIGLWVSTTAAICVIIICLIFAVARRRRPRPAG